MVAMVTTMMAAHTITDITYTMNIMFDFLSFCILKRTRGEKIVILIYLSQILVIDIFISNNYFITDNARHS